MFTFFGAISSYLEHSANACGRTRRAPRAPRPRDSAKTKSFAVSQWAGEGGREGEGVAAP